MTSASRRPWARTAGLTLVVIVVVAILGLLAMIVVKNVAALNRPSRTTRARADVGVIAEAVKAFVAQRGRLPNNLDELVKGDAKNPPLIAELVLDPWDHDYHLQASSPGGWSVVSAGPDGDLGSDDDIRSGAVK